MSFLTNYFSSSSSAPTPPPQLSRQSSLTSMPSIPSVPSTLTRSISTSSNASSSFELIDKQVQSPASTPHGQWFADAPVTPLNLSRQGSTNVKSKKSFAQIFADSNRQINSSSSQISPPTPSTPFSMIEHSQNSSVPPSPFQLSRNASFEHVSHADAEPEFTSPPAVVEEQANEEGYSDEEEEERCFYHYSGYNESMHDIRVATKHKSNISFEYEGSLTSGNQLFKVRHRPLSNFELPQNHSYGPAPIDGSMNFYQTKSGSAHRLQHVALGMRDGPQRLHDANLYKQDALPSPFVQDQNVKRTHVKPSSSPHHPRSNHSHDDDDDGDGSTDTSRSTRSAWFEVHAQRQQRIKREKAKKEDKALATAAAQREAVHAHRQATSAQKKPPKDKNRGYRSQPVPFGSVDSSIDLLSPSSLKSIDTFRVAFYRYYAQLIQHAFGSDHDVRYFGKKVTGIRICPLSSHASNGFLKRLRSMPLKVNDFTTPLRAWFTSAHDPKSHLHSASQLPELTLSFHGTTLHAMEAIIHNGFIAPSTKNGIMPHGNRRWWYSDFSEYVFSSLTAHDATSYASNSSTLFVCASIPLSWQEKLDLKFNHYLAPDQLAMPTGANGACSDRMIPLFLLDFEVLPHFGMGGSMRRKYNSEEIVCGTDSRHTSTKRREQGPQINTSWVRKELRKKHTLAHQEAMRQHAHQVATSGASTNLVEMANLPDQYCTPDEDDPDERWQAEDEEETQRARFTRDDFESEKSSDLQALKHELQALLR